MVEAKLVKVLNELCESGVLFARWSHGLAYQLTLSGPTYDALIAERRPMPCDEFGHTLLNGCVIVRGGA